MANSKRKRKGERERNRNRRMVHQKWQIKAAIKQQQSQIQKCPKLGTINGEGGGELLGEWRSEFELHIYSPSEAKWSVVFVAAALTLSNAVEKRRETDASESALPFDRSCCPYIQHLSLSRTTHIEFQQIPITNCTTNGMSNSSGESNNKSKQSSAEHKQCIALHALHQG